MTVSLDDSDNDIVNISLKNLKLISYKLHKTVSVDRSIEGFGTAKVQKIYSQRVFNF